jgi:plasmid stabilization system protein ParE
MNVRVVFSEDFRADLRSQTRRLVADDKLDWAQRLIDEVALVARLLGASPRAGPVETTRSGRSIRRVVFRRLPFVVWYHFQESARTVVVLRLFHVRQRRLRSRQSQTERFPIGLASRTRVRLSS